MATRWLATAAVAAVASIAMVGCDDGAGIPTASSSTQSATTTMDPSTSTPTPTKSLTPAQQDLADAEQSIATYWKVIDETASNPKTDLNVLATVARDQALAQWQSTLAEYRSKGWVVSGNSTLQGVTAKKVGKDHFTVSVCRDVSAVEVVDGAGNSVVQESRPDRQRFTYKVQKTPQGFFVTEDLLKGEPCDA